MKSKHQRRVDALHRMLKATYENSRAKRRGKTQSEWAEENAARYAHLAKLVS